MSRMGGYHIDAESVKRFDAKRLGEALRRMLCEMRRRDRKAGR